MVRTMGMGMNGVASRAAWLLPESLAAGLFIPRRKLAIISRANSIRLFFFITKTPLLIFSIFMLRCASETPTD